MELEEKVRRLGQLRVLRREADMLSQRVAELEQAARGGERISGLPGQWRLAEGEGTPGELARLWKRLEERRTRCLEELGALYALIDDIDDSLLRQILTYRYVDGDCWRQVAERIGEKDEQYPRRLHNRFLERWEMER